MKTDADLSVLNLIFITIIFLLTVQAVASPTDTLRILSWNLENLFDDVLDGGEYPEYRPGRFGWCSAMYDRKLSSLSDVIAAAQPDIAVVCEIENIHTAQSLRRFLLDRECHLPYIAITDSNTTGTTSTAILSKFPIIEREIISIPFETATIRPMLRIKVFPFSSSFEIFALHWPARTHPENSRTTAAQILREHLLKRPPEADYIVAGDFNSDYNEAETQPSVATAINHVLNTASSAPTERLVLRTSDSMAGSPTGTLFEPWQEVREDRRFSYVYQGRSNTLDHILLSPGLFDKVGFSYIDRSFSPFFWNGRLLLNNQPFRWQILRLKSGTVHAGTGFSDHLPVMLKIVRAPFAHCDSSLVPAPNRYYADFEIGRCGFRESAKIRLARDTNCAATGHYSLRLSGIPSETGRIVSSTFHFSDTTTHYLTFNIKGFGEIAFRIRPFGGKWEYYRFDGLSSENPSKSYSAFRSSTFKSISLHLHSSTTSMFDFEIRSRGKIPLRLWLDSFEGRSDNLSF